MREAGHLGHTIRMILPTYGKSFAKRGCPTGWYDYPWWESAEVIPRDLAGASAMPALAAVYGGTMSDAGLAGRRRGARNATRVALLVACLLSPSVAAAQAPASSVNLGDLVGATLRDNADGVLRMLSYSTTPGAAAS
jgi:hypothetical protein